METLEESYQDSRIRRILRPLGRLAHPFRGRDPLGLDMSPYADRPNAVSLSPSAEGPIVTIMNAVDGDLEHEPSYVEIKPGDP